MGRKRYSVEQIIRHLRQSEVYPSCPIFLEVAKKPCPPGYPFLSFPAKGCCPG